MDAEPRITREKIMNLIGLGLLLACVGASLFGVMTRRSEEKQSGKTTIRFAHWQLEGSVREAFDRAVRAYEALHPDVKIEQMAIPDRIYKNWLKTQLIGGTAPQIVQIGGSAGVTDETLAREFLPLGSYLEDPNPYNAGTDLAQIPWRETFLDGLQVSPAYNESLIDHFGISMSMFTIRLFYNKELLQKISGSETPPEDLDGFLALCRKASTYRDESGLGVVPIAGSKYNAPFLSNALFETQTQRLAFELDRRKRLANSPEDQALDHLAGRWTWQTPGVESGLSLMQALGQFMQPGFLQLGRDDATFYFAQSRALMIATGSWDASSIRAQAPFEVGVCAIPLPSPSDPHYGQNMLGRPSEAGTGTAAALGVVRSAPHTEVAIDFLRFLGSRQGNQIFASASGWLPAIDGVEPAPEAKPFQPYLEGFIRGFRPSLNMGADTTRAIENNIFRLVNPQGSVAGFTKAVEAPYRLGLESDLRRKLRDGARRLVAKDSQTVALSILSQAPEGASAAALRLNRLLESQNDEESRYYHVRRAMKRLNLDTEKY
jgi:raffinose/stachyose/melibiose transport system substrate-binding protein